MRYYYKGKFFEFQPRNGKCNEHIDVGIIDFVIARIDILKIRYGIEVNIKMVMNDSDHAGYIFYVEAHIPYSSSLKCEEEIWIGKLIKLALHDGEVPTKDGLCINVAEIYFLDVAPIVELTDD